MYRAGKVNNDRKLFRFVNSLLSIVFIGPC